jgi:multimeric flavodoxin WrbA
VTFTFVLGSTRRHSNSEQLARRAAHALPDARWIHLLDHPLPPFHDLRHGTGFPPLDGNAKLLADATIAATDLVLVTPVYWYSVSWLMKLYLDHWTHWLRIPELAFKDTLRGRNFWSVIVDSDDEASGSGNATVDMLRRTADYMEMSFRGVLQGHANRPGEITLDERALAQAATFFG